MILKKAPLPNRKKTFLWLGIIVLIVLLVGGVAALYLSQTNQDVRQQASGFECGDPINSKGNSCVSKESCLAGGSQTGNCNQGVCCKASHITDPSKGDPKDGGSGGGGGGGGRSADGTRNGCGYLNNTGATTPAGSSCDNSNCGNRSCEKFTFKCGTLCYDSACGASACVPDSSPPPKSEPPTVNCAQIAGKCIGKDGSSCVGYTDSCNRADVCASPVVTCEDQKPTPSPTPTPTPTPTPEPEDNDDDGGQQIAAAPTPTPTPAPVVLPSTLPETGPEDWLKHLGIGIGILGAGALLLLFL